MGGIAPSFRSVYQGGCCGTFSLLTRSDSVEPSRAAIDLATKTFFYEPKVISDCIAFRSEKAGEGITQLLFAADNCFGVTFGKYTAVVYSRIPMNCFAPSIVRSDNVQPFCEMPIGVLSQFAGPYLPQPAEPRIPNPIALGHSSRLRAR